VEGKEGDERMRLLKKRLKAAQPSIFSLFSHFNYYISEIIGPSLEIIINDDSLDTQIENTQRKLDELLVCIFIS
jgi:hypothetical protein